MGSYPAEPQGELPEICLKRRKKEEVEIEKEKKKEDLTSLTIWCCFPDEVVFFPPMVLPPKREESKMRQDRGIVYSDVSRENIHCCDAGM